MIDEIYYMDFDAMKLAAVAISTGDYALAAASYARAINLLDQYPGESAAPARAAHSLSLKEEEARRKLKETGNLHTLQPAAWDLTESEFMMGRQCLKHLYLHRAGKSYAGEELDQEHPANICADTFREPRFPAGIHIEAEIGTNPKYLPAFTDYLLGRHQKVTLFDGAFIAHGIMVQADVLDQSEDGRIDCYSVVEGNEVNELAFDHLALKHAVLEQRFAGRLDHFYCVMGSWGPGWNIMDLSDKLRERSQRIFEYIDSFRKFVREAGEEPDIHMGFHCFWLHACRFQGYCSRYMGSNPSDPSDEIPF